MVVNKAVFAVALALACSPACADSGCQLSLKPSTSGFFLNPTIEKVLVVKATSKNPERPCRLLANDELLQINERVIPGAKAKDVMAYWHSLPKGTQRIFKVRRAGTVVSIVTE